MLHIYTIKYLSFEDNIYNVSRDKNDNNMIIH